MILRVIFTNIPRIHSFISQFPCVFVKDVGLFDLRISSYNIMQAAFVCLLYYELIILL